MSPELITRLVGWEYAMCAIDGELANLSAELLGTAIPGSQKASQVLMLARRYVRHALERIDEPLTRAAKLAEMLEPAPF